MCRPNTVVRWTTLSTIILLSSGAHICGAQQLQRNPSRLGYLLYLPKKTWISKARWPLILYLHGKSLRGNDLNRITKYGLPKRLLKDKGFPFITLCPQLPDGQRWTDTKALMILVNEVCNKYPVDRTRVYAVGFSMGASGAWRVAHDFPNRFSAIVSVGGLYEKPLAADHRLNSIPVWMIHGAQDTEASEQAAKEVFDKLIKSGGSGQFTVLPGKGHNIPYVFDQSDIYQWLLKHRKSAAPARTKKA